MVAGRPGRNREEVQYCSHEAEKNKEVRVKSREKNKGKQGGNQQGWERTTEAP